MRWHKSLASLGSQFFQDLTMLQVSQLSGDLRGMARLQLPCTSRTKPLFQMSSLRSLDNTKYRYSDRAKSRKLKFFLKERINKKVKQNISLAPRMVELRLRSPSVKLSDGHNYASFIFVDMFHMFHGHMARSFWVIFLGLLMFAVKIWGDPSFWGALCTAPFGSRGFLSTGRVEMPLGWSTWPSRKTSWRTCWTNCWTTKSWLSHRQFYTSLLA